MAPFCRLSPTLGVTSQVHRLRLVLPFVFHAGALLYANSSARMTLVAVSGAVDTTAQLRSGLLVGLPSAIFVSLFFVLFEYGRG